MSCLAARSRLTRRDALVRLALCGAGAAAIYAGAFSAPYSIENGLARPLLHFGLISGPSLGPTAGFVVAIVALFILYAAAVRLCSLLEGSRLATLIVMAAGVLAALALVPMYPVFSLDVFYYMAADRIWSVYHENPFVVPPLQAAHDPFFPYTAWGHYPLPYGPLWPWISAATSAFGGGAILQTLLSFKALAALGYLACLPVVLWAAEGVNPGRRLTGACIFAWNPVVLLELVGNAHNDAVTLVPAALGLGLWARRRTTLATLAVTASFLIKASVLVAIPALLWPPFRRALHSQRLSWWLAAHVVPAAGLCVLAWLPFWGGVGLLREVDQHYQSATTLLMAAVPYAWKAPALRALQLALAAGFVAYYASQRQVLASEGRPAARAIWRITVLYFLVVSPFYSAWYLVWPTLLAALLAERRTTALNSLLCVGGMATYLVQFVLQPVAGPALGWAQINSLGLLAAFGPFVVGWLALTWRRAQRPGVPATSHG